MMTKQTCDNQTPCLLLPILLIALTMALFFGYQMTQLLHEKEGAKLAYNAQETALQDSQRLAGQLTTLVLGTKKMAEDNNTQAKALYELLLDNTVQMARAGNPGARFLLERLQAESKTPDGQPMMPPPGMQPATMPPGAPAGMPPAPPPARP